MGGIISLLCEEGVVAVTLGYIVALGVGVGLRGLKTSPDFLGVLKKIPEDKDFRREAHALCSLEEAITFGRLGGCGGVSPCRRGLPI